MQIDVVFNEFCNWLATRTGAMTEDNIRYYWFVAMLKQDNNLNNYTLEASYSNLAKKELDLLYSPSIGENWAMEMKFHRKTQSTFAHTDAAGAIFNDLFRLTSYKSNGDLRRLFLYVTDSEMDGYLKNGSSTDLFRKLLKEFYTMSVNDSQKISLGGITAPDTFVQSAKASSNAITSNVRLLQKWDFYEMNSLSFHGRECHVRLYEVHEQMLNISKENCTKEESSHPPSRPNIFDSWYEGF